MIAHDVVRLLLAEAVLDVDEVEDQAADFIEDQVGRFHFPCNWRRDRDKYLGLLDQMPDGDKILAEIDRLAAEDAEWTDADEDDVIDLVGSPLKTKKQDAGRHRHSPPAV